MSGSKIRLASWPDLSGRILSGGRVSKAALLLLAVTLQWACADSFEAMAQKAAKDPDLAYDAALQSMASGNYPAAEIHLRRALEIRPGNGRFIQALCLVKTLERDYPGVIELAGRALAADPGLTDVKNNRGIAYLELGRAVEAERDFRDVLADPRYPQRTNPRFNLGVALLRQGRAAESITEFYEVQRANPGFQGLYSLIGEAKELSGDPKAAVANYIEALKKESKDYSSMLHLAGCLEKMGDSKLAQRYYRRINESAPASPEAAAARNRLAGLSGEVVLPLPSSTTVAVPAPEEVSSLVAPAVTAATPPPTP